MDLAVALSVIAVLAFTLGVLVGKGAKPDVATNPRPLLDEGSSGEGNDLGTGLALLGPQTAMSDLSSESSGDQVDTEAADMQPGQPSAPGDQVPGGEPLAGLAGPLALLGSDAPSDTPKDVGPSMQFGSPQGRPGRPGQLGQSGESRGELRQDFGPQRLMVLGERLSSVAAFSDDSTHAGAPGHSAGGAAVTTAAFKPLLADWRGQVESIRGVSKSVNAWDTKLADGETFVALQGDAGDGEPSEQHGALALVLSLSEQLDDSAADLSESLAALDLRARAARYEWQVAEAEGSEEYLAMSTLGERLLLTQVGFREVLSRSKLAERRLFQARTAVDELSQSLRGVDDDDYSGSATLLAERVVDPVKVKLDTAIQGMTRVRARLESDSQALVRAMDLFDLPEAAGDSAEPSTAGLSEPLDQPTRSGRGKVRQDHVGPSPFDGGERFQGPAF